jgi:hypothetical protein
MKPTNALTRTRIENWFIFGRKPSTQNLLSKTKPISVAYSAESIDGGIL